MATPAQIEVFKTLCESFMRERGIVWNEDDILMADYISLKDLTDLLSSTSLTLLKLKTTHTEMSDEELVNQLIK